MTPHSTIAQDHPPAFTLEDFPPLQRNNSPVISETSHSPISSPSFMDPSLLKSLDIFSGKSPLSPSTIPMDSIRFENVTIRKSSKEKPTNASRSSGLYTPLLARIKAVAKSTNSPQALIALSPNSQVDL